MRIALAFLLAALAPATVASAQPPIFPGQQGAALRTALVGTYRPATVLSLDASKDRLYDTVERDTVGGVVGVRCVYTGYFVAFDCSPSCDPSQDVFNQPNENTQGINQEHTWPRGEGADTGNAERDLHNHFASKVNVNAERADFPFGESPDAQTSEWYYLGGSQAAAPPLATRDLWSERQGSTRFEPREERKGDVARAMFYFYTMYGPDGTGQASTPYFEGQKAVLRAWHEADPVSPREYQRMLRAAQFQRTPTNATQPNPFILDSTLVRRAYFPSTPPPATLAAQVHVLLAGPYRAPVGGAPERMDATLAAANLLPASQPYTDSFFDGTALDYGGAEAVAPGFFAAHPEVVDWVLVELRPTPTAASVARRAAFLTRTGLVVDTSGTVPLPFPGVAAGTYHVVVRHRNHLPATSAAVSFPGGTTTVDLTTGPGAGSPQVVVGSGLYALAPGDLDADGGVDAADAALWRTQNGTPPAYRQEDATLDGRATAADLQRGVRR